MSAIFRIYPRSPALPIVEQVALAVPNLAATGILGAALRHAGCEVYSVSTSEEARRLVRAGVATTAILATDLRGESGWLTCAKLQWSHPEVRILLYGPDSALNRRRAAFVGAAALLADPDAVLGWLRPRSSLRSKLRN